VNANVGDKHTASNLHIRLISVQTLHRTANDPKKQVREKVAENSRAA